MMFSKTQRAVFLAIFGAGQLAGATEAASPVKGHDCATLMASQVPFVLTLRNDAMTLVRGDGTTATTPSVSRMRVLRGDDGRVTAFLLPGREGQASIVSEKRYWRTLASTSSEGVRTVLAREVPPTNDPVAARADFTESYTRSVPGKPPLRQRMDAVFVGEGEIELGPLSHPPLPHDATRRTVTGRQANQHIGRRLRAGPDGPRPQRVTP